jgi:hypothetical protein
MVLFALTGDIAEKNIEELFKVMLKALKGQYDVGVAFVSVLNPALSMLIQINSECG